MLALGYNNSVHFIPQSAAGLGKNENSSSDSWSNYRRALPITWADISQGGGSTTLCINQPVQLDFGAAGKGYFVDLVTQIIKEELSGDSPADSDSPADFDFLVNAGGDMRACFSKENSQIKVALELMRLTAFLLAIYAQVGRIFLLKLAIFQRLMPMRSQLRCLYRKKAICKKSCKMLALSLL